jgi:sigma-B regulation protein RsbU (phosphoserine phosphatase)
MEQSVYTEESVEIKPGDMLFMYTDGLFEIMNKDREMFGSERINSALRACTTTDTSVMLLSILQSAFKFAGIESKSMLADDLTMSFVELKS